MRTGRVGGTVIAAALLALTACSTSANPTGPAAGEPTSASASDTGIPVEVGEHEYSITLPRKNFTPGTYTFVVDNTGRAGHDLTIKGPGVEVAKIMPAGSQAEVVVALRPGTYELWCSIDNHRDRGMRQTVTVAG
jgi:plastocyanin